MCTKSTTPFGRKIIMSLAGAPISPSSSENLSEKNSQEKLRVHLSSKKFRQAERYPYQFKVQVEIISPWSCITLVLNNGRNRFRSHHKLESCKKHDRLGQNTVSLYVCCANSFVGRKCDYTAICPFVPASAWCFQPSTSISFGIKS